MRKTFAPRRRQAFSLIELLVVLAATSTVLGLFVTATQDFRAAAGRMQSSNNLKQMSLAMHSCQDVFKKLPPAIGWFPVNQPLWATPAAHGTAFYHILPFVEGDVIHNNTTGFSASSTRTAVSLYIAPLDFTAPKNGLHSHNRGAISYAVNTYALMDYRNFVDFGYYNGSNPGSPSAVGAAYNVWGYAGRPRDGSNKAQTSLPKITAQDGTSNTIAFAERFATCETPVLDREGRLVSSRSFERVWGEDLQGYNNFSPAVFRPLTPPPRKDAIGLVPPELMPQFGATRTNCQPATWQALDSRVLQLSMFDGSVRAVSPRISRETWTNVLLPDDGNVIGPDF